MTYPIAQQARQRRRVRPIGVSGIVITQRSESKWVVVGGADAYKLARLVEPNCVTNSPVLPVRR